MTLGGLGRYLALRVGRMAATLGGISLLVFLLMSAAPGDPAKLALSGGSRRAASPETVEAFRADYALDRPLPARFAAWLRRAATFDFGRSLQDGRPVGERIAETLPATLALNVPALLLSLLIAVPAGIAAARRPGGGFDRASAVLLDLLFAAPPFVVGLLLLLVFAVQLRLMPVFSGPEEGARGLVLPVVSLALAVCAPTARIVRQAVGTALASPAAAAGRARGEDPAAEIRRALRRSAGPLAALLATLLPSAVAGSVLVERLFSIPGTGALLADAVFARDVPVVLGVTLLTAIVVLAGSLLSDLAAAFFDPRLRIGTGDAVRTEAV